MNRRVLFNPSVCFTCIFTLDAVQTKKLEYSVHVSVLSAGITCSSFHYFSRYLKCSGNASQEFLLHSSGKIVPILALNFRSQSASYCNYHKCPIIDEIMRKAWYGELVSLRKQQCNEIHHVFLYQMALNEIWNKQSPLARIYVFMCHVLCVCVWSISFCIYPFYNGAQCDSFRDKERLPPSKCSIDNFGQLKGCPVI